MNSRTERALTQKFKEIGMNPETGYVMWMRGKKPWERLPVEVTQNYGFVKTKRQGCMYFNEEGLVHRIGGYALEHEGGVKEWWVKGKCHRLNGPAAESRHGNGWWVNNVETEHPDLCEKSFPKQQLVNLFFGEPPQECHAHNLSLPQTRPH